MKTNTIRLTIGDKTYRVPKGTTYGELLRTTATPLTEKAIAKNIAALQRPMKCLSLPSNRKIVHRRNGKIVNRNAKIKVGDTFTIELF